MLRKISLTNVGSVKGEQTLDFSKGKYEYKKNMLTASGELNPIGIFGCNGSGKTILLNALDGIGSLMTSETSYVRSILPNIPNGWKENIIIKLEFVLDGCNFKYVLKKTWHCIISEVLTVDKEKIFTRNRSKHMVYQNNKVIHEVKNQGKNYSALRSIGKEIYNDKGSFYNISTAFQYLASIVYIPVDGDIRGRLIEENKLNDILVNKSSDVKKILKGYGNFPVYDIEFEEGAAGMEGEIHFKNEGDTDFLPEFLMSNGMKSHSKLISTILSMPPGCLVVVDEIERNLHPFVAGKFIETFNKKFDVQLIFSTHNSHLLQVLRPDQIFFSKLEKENCSSKYEKLSESHPNLREVNNIEKMYFGGLLDE